MAAKILVHSADREVGSLFSNLLQQYHHETWLAATITESAALARSAGPMDLVLCLDDRAAAGELRGQLRELAPDTRFLQLPSLRTVALDGAEARLDSPGVLLEAAELLEMVESALALAERGAGNPAVQPERLKDALVETVLTFTLLLEQFEFINGANGRQIMDYSMRVARELGLSPTHVEEIGFAAILQDIGLFKRRRGKPAGPEEDPQKVREHPIRSANLIQRMKLPWKLRHIVLAHHEWYNGRGYPHGLKGREIPLGARILTVTNTFFAMISRRPGRDPLRKNEAAEELRRLVGRQFDPEVVEVFLSIMKDKSFHAEGKPRRVLIAGTDEILAGLARHRFESTGTLATVVTSGVETLAALRATPHDAVLLDATLTDMSGFQLLHWVRSDAELAVLPVVVVSGDADCSTHSFMAHDMGADDFLLKPVRASELVSRINAVLRRRDRLARAEFSQVHEGEGLRGSLEELSVPDLVNLMHEGRKSATVMLFLADGVASLAFDGGVLVHARTLEASGDEAVRQLFLVREGDYFIEHGAATAERTVTRRMDLLVAESMAARQQLLASERKAMLAAASSDALESELLERVNSELKASASASDPDSTETQELDRTVLGNSPSGTTRSDITRDLGPERRSDVTLLATRR